MKHEAITLNDPRAMTAIARWDELKTERSRYEADWEDVAALFRPMRGGFSGYDHNSRRREKPLSSEPILAASSFASGLYANLSNSASNWFSLELEDKDLMAWKPVAEWTERVTRMVQRTLHPSMSSFYPALFQGYADIASFGNAAGYDQFDLATRKFIDVSLSLAEVVVAIDFHGRVVEVVRRGWFTPEQIVREFGRAPEKIEQAAEKRDTAKIAVYQHIKLNEEFRAGYLGPKGKRWLSVHAVEEGKALLRTAGYDEMPFYYPRWDVESGATYGTGPAMNALPSARLNQQMEAAVIRAAQQAADPTKLIPSRSDWQINGRIAPGQLVEGGLNMLNGRKMIETLDTTGNIGITDAMQRAKVEEVKGAMHYAMLGLANRTGVTPEETMIQEEQRLREWAPHSDRIMEELLVRKIERRYSTLLRMRQIPPPPIPEAGEKPLKVTYQSAAAMAMAAREGLAVNRYLSTTLPLAQYDPRVMDRIDTDGVLEVLHDANPSLPHKIMRSREEADQRAEARAEQQRAAQAMEAGEKGAGIMEKLAKAGLGGGDAGQ